MSNIFSCAISKTRHLSGRSSHKPLCCQVVFTPFAFLNLPYYSHPISPVPAMFQVPFPPNINFVGRHDILAEIEAVVRKNQEADGCVPTVLKGLGGMGKSQLMLKYCDEHRKEYEHVIWLNVQGSPATLEELRKLAKKLGIKVDDDEDLTENIREWFQSREGRWLLLLDNLDAFDDVSDFLPQFGGDVIITTRNHFDDSYGSIILIDKMVEKDALLL